MNLVRKIPLLLLLLLWSGTNAQDTLTIVHYNLLNYGVITDWCDNSNNNIQNKDGYLQTLIDYLLPDVFTVNEISRSPSIHQHLLDEVLNTDGRDHYGKANFLSVSESDIVNMLYYNTRKLTFHSHVIAQSQLRDIDVYSLYLNSSDLIRGDTLFLHFIVAHLKAGNETPDRIQRRIMAENTMNYLENNRLPGNYLFLGDLNIYTDEEPAYLQLLEYSNTSWRFQDPVNRAGPWHNNSNYSDLHTQSTHYSSNGCPASGGMDDRFDFILASDDIMAGKKKVRYIQDSYRVIGQDGNHFNKSIIALPVNNSVPNDVLNALFYNSDHLPVMVKLIADQTMHIKNYPYATFDEIQMVSPASDHLLIRLDSRESIRLTLSINSLRGDVLCYEKRTIERGQNTILLDINHFAPGIYLVRFADQKGGSVVKKLVVK